jgi:creatinine amidohydrolase
MPGRNRQRGAEPSRPLQRSRGAHGQSAGTGAGFVLWQELSSPEIAALDRERTVVVLPVGSVEQHGFHMPVGTDTMLAVAVAEAAAGKAAVPSAILPPPWYGFSAHHMGFAGTVTLRPETMMALVEDIVASVIGHGFRRLLVVNGHGGNGGVIDVLAAKLGNRFYGSARVACLTYFQLARDEIAALRRSSPGGMGHACEFEASLLMHLRPALVHQDRAAVCYPETGSAYLITDLLGGSAVRTYHDFRDLSDTGTLGDPSLASAELGARFFTAVSDTLARFIEDFAQWRIPETSP